MTYRVTVNFNGYIGCDEEYVVEADSREEAGEYAINEAMCDLYVEDIEEEE